jgi:uncharacterized repeat protein (TIGR01451 family)
MRDIFQRRHLSWILVTALMLVCVACRFESGPGIASDDDGTPVHLRATVDRAVAEPGDIITFTISAEYQSDVTLELPEVADKLSAFRIVDSSLSPPIREDGHFTTERSYKLQADIAGSYVVEPITVPYSFPDGKQDVVKTPKIFIEIESILAKEDDVEDIRDIKPPMVVSYLYRTIFSVLAVLFGLILVVVFIRMLVAWRRNRAEARKMALRPAHEEALEALEMLLNKRLVEKGRMKKFCFEISIIFRRYMQARFGIPALDLTTEEIIPRVEEDGISEESLRQIIREFLVDTDLVKFAKYAPTVDEMKTILQHTRTFIEQTTVELAVGAGNPEEGERR